MKIVKFCIVFFFLFLTSCSSLGKKETVKLQSESIKNKSENEIISLYGNANNSWYDTKGNKISEYRYSKNHYDVLSYFPILCYFGKISTENYITVVTYNSNKIVVEQKNLFLNENISNGL